MTTDPQTAAAKPLTPKQAAFCREYLVDLNGTQAAIRAGYSAKTARVVAAQNLAKPNIEAEISRLMKERANRTDASADTVVRELMQLALSDIGEAFNADGSLKALHEMPVEIRRAIAGVDVFEEFAGRGEDREQVGWTKKLRLWDKPKALELLGRHLKMFSDKIEVTGKDGGPLELGPQRPSRDAVAEFTSAAYAGYTGHRDAKGNAAPLDSRATNSLSEVIGDFAAGGDFHGDPHQLGAQFARGRLIADAVRSPASFQGDDTDETS